MPFQSNPASILSTEVVTALGSPKRVEVDPWPSDPQTGEKVRVWGEVSPPFWQFSPCKTTCFASV